MPIVEPSGAPGGGAQPVYAFGGISNPITDGTDFLLPLFKTIPNFPNVLGQDPVCTCSSGIPETLAAGAGFSFIVAVPLSYFAANPAINMYCLLSVSNGAGTQKISVGLDANVPFVASTYAAVPDFSAATWFSEEQIGSDLSQPDGTLSPDPKIVSAAGGQYFANFFVQITVP